MTLRLHLALSIGPQPGRDDDLTDELLRAVYVEHRDRLLAHQPGRPWAWWQFEPNVPESLRPGRPALVPVDAPDPSVDLERHQAEWLQRSGRG